MLRIYSGNSCRLSEEKQLLFVGDIYQLEPVVTQDARDILNRFYPNSYFFSARVFKEVSLVPIELKKVYRQTDITFVNLLDRIRTNTTDDNDLKILNSRYNPNFIPQQEDFSITLATRRDNVDYINDKHLADLDGKEFVFKGEIKGRFSRIKSSYIKRVDSQRGCTNNFYQKRL